MLNDAHCHFFSSHFFAALARQRSQQTGGTPQTAAEIANELGWDDPGEPEALADRWVRELDTHGVHRAALIASVPGDEDSVAAAAARHPTRIVGFFMLNPAAPDAGERTRHALRDLRLKGVCLFPAMHRVSLGDPRTLRVVEAAAELRDAGLPVAVFAHCGLLSVGVRQKLGLPSDFDMGLGEPIEVSRLALAFPRVPFIIPHFGAGQLAEALMALETCPNVHLDTSSSNAWIDDVPGLTLEDVFRDVLKAAGPSRLLFGTDSSYFPRGWQKAVFDRQRTALDRLAVSDDDAELIFGGNFDRLFP